MLGIEVTFKFYRFLPDEELEKRAPQAYQLLSSIFVKIEPAGYGTRYLFKMKSIKPALISCF